jgi:hypothetical protein
MIIKLQNVLYPYARQREAKKPIVLSRQDKVNADRIVMIFLFALSIVAAVIFS